MRRCAVIAINEHRVSNLAPSDGNHPGLTVLATAIGAPARAFPDSGGSIGQKTAPVISKLVIQRIGITGGLRRIDRKRNRCSSTKTFVAGPNQPV